jgi:hypothetical protein
MSLLHQSAQKRQPQNKRPYLNLHPHRGQLKRLQTLLTLHHNLREIQGLTTLTETMIGVTVI